MSVKIRPEDKWFSLYIRARDGWACQRCGRRFRPYIEGGDNTHLKGLHCAHMFGRGAHMTRWQEDNVLSLCYGDHSYLDSHSVEKVAFFTERLGKERFDDLGRLSHQPYHGWKRDAKEIVKLYKFKFQQYLQKVPIKLQ